MTGQDRVVLAKTVWGEARSEGYDGMQAVANVVMNRVAKGGWWGNTVIDVCLYPWQFSAWNENDPNRALMENVDEADPQYRTALEIASMAISGTLPDITDGATHYKHKAVSAAWADDNKKVAMIGVHEFYRGIA